MRRIMILSLTFFVVWSTGGMVQAESASVLLEKGIYAEETAGNLDEAMGIYQKIIADEQANRQAAAQAYYRLGKCYQKKGDNVKAIELFQKMIANYPEQKELIAKVQKFVPAVQSGAVPRVVRTMPVTLANDVSPDLKEMTVTFDQLMKDNSWAWCTDSVKAKFPETIGKPHYDSERMINRYAIHLEPGTVYWVSLNTPGYIGFKSARGIASPQYVILFATKDKDGKPTPIPEELIAQAKYINTTNQTLSVSAGDFTKPAEVEPAPWRDGEVMRLRVNTISGMEIGTLIWTAKSIKEAEKDLWRIESFMTIPISNTEQFTRVDAEMKNFLPVFGWTDRNQLGDYKSVYTKGKVVRRRTARDGKEAARSVNVDMVVYDNEQALYLIRRMPLKKNFIGAFNILSIEATSPVVCQVYVVKQEKLTVSAGTYDCYKLELSIYSAGERMLQHTLWLSADEHKYLIKYDSGSSILELAEVSQLSKDQPMKFSDKEMGISLKAPAGWFFYKEPAPGKYKFVLHLLPPEMKTWALLTASERGDAGQTIQQVVDGDIEVLKGYFKNYIVRKDSRKEMTISGLPAIRYIADYEDKEQKKVEYRTYILGHSQVYWFVFRIDKNQFEKNQKEFDSIVNSFKAKFVYTPPKKVTKEDKLEAEKLSAQGWKLWQERKLSEAEELFKKAVDKDPKNTNAWNGLGWSQFQQGMYENGIVAFEKCIALDPKHAAALNGLGFIAKTQNRTNEAIRYWERAVEASPHMIASLSGLTQTYMELKQYDKAVKYYEKWLAVEPNNAEAKEGLEKAKAMMAATSGAKN